MHKPDAVAQVSGHNQSHESSSGLLSRRGSPGWMVTWLPRCDQTLGLFTQGVKGNGPGRSRLAVSSQVPVGIDSLPVQA